MEQTDPRTPARLAFAGSYESLHSRLCTLLCNSRSMFRQLLGSLQDLIRRNAIRGRHIIET